MVRAHERRALLQGMALIGSQLAARPAFAATGNPADESYWENVRAAYTPQKPLLNLNNAGVSPSTLAVQDVVIKAFRFANEQPDVNMWNDLDNARPAAKEKLAALIDCAPAEIALNRNSSEGLCTAIFGIPLKSGDEVLLSTWDYASMRAAWDQRRAREGIVIVPVDYDLMDSDDDIVAAYAKAITPRTKVMHFTHMSNYTGRVLPGERLCAVANKQGIITVVDAAQSFAQIPVSFRKMDCDYMAASLHKWLCAPIGTGMLIVRERRINETWPLLAPFDANPVGIAKLDHFNLGTYPSFIEYGISPAVDFHNSIGTARVHERLRALSRYWVGKASGIKGFKMHTLMDRTDVGAVTAFSIGATKVEEIEEKLRKDHNIRVRYRRVSTLATVRVSPHIFTLKSDLDRFVDALHAVAKST